MTTDEVSPILSIYTNSNVDAYNYFIELTATEPESNTVAIHYVAINVIAKPEGYFFNQTEESANNSTL